jgi:hypothetical protein
MPKKNGDPTQHEVIVSMLRRGPVTSGQFVEVNILRYSARIEELNNDKGYDIRSEPIKGSAQWRYTLAAEPGLSEAEQRPGPSAPRSVSASESSESLFDLPPSAISAITGKRAA